MTPVSRRGVLAALFQPSSKDHDPRVLRPAPDNEASLVTLPNGTIRLFFSQRNQAICSIESKDGGSSWSEVRREFAVPGPTAHACVAMLDRRGAIHVFFLVFRGEGRNLGVDRLLDVWHARQTGTVWNEPKRIFEGYVGALRAACETRRGRIVVPFAAWVAGRKSGPPSGSNEVTAVYSDDSGATWSLSPARLTSPCVEGYNGSQYGAVEPCLVERNDGRLWMLIRTQTGRLYESFSQDGAAWSDARPAPFWSSNSPAALLRLRNGSLLLAWNNCLPPPMHEGQGVYGGRDALHAALSSDDGKTWRGFREVYLDPTRNQAPPKRGDRATAYPFLTETREGSVLLVTGQGEGRRALVRFHPDWLLRRDRLADFHDGLNSWSVYESIGPAVGYWRDRRVAASLSRHEDRPALELGKGAVWNIPASTRGKLQAELVLPAGAEGATLSLTDHFRDPCDDAGEESACFTIDLMPGQRQLAVRWDQAGAHIGSRTFRWKRPPEHGVSYVRFRSRTGGVLILSVKAMT